MTDVFKCRKPGTQCCASKTQIREVVEQKTGGHGPSGQPQQPQQYPQQQQYQPQQPLQQYQPQQPLQQYQPSPPSPLPQQQQPLASQSYGSFSQRNDTAVPPFRPHVPSSLQVYTPPPSKYTMRIRIC